MDTDMNLNDAADLLVEAEAVRPRIGGMVRDARVEAGIKQQDLAESMGISTPYLSHLETGKRAWNRRTIEAAIVALGKALYP